MWFFLILFVPLFAIAFPRVANAFNLFFTFPMVTLTFGTMSWIALNIFTGFSFFSWIPWSLCMLIIGLPIGIMMTKETLN